jgi:hypothetical protein
MVSLLVLLIAADRQIVTTSDRAALIAFAQRHGGTVRSCPLARTCIVEGAPDLRGLPFVSAVDDDVVTPAPIVTTHYTVSTQDCGALWELAELRAESVWTEVRGEHAPTIAVLDGGFRTGHPDLAGRISGEYDYGNHDAVANVVWSAAIPHHGTFILGMLAALSTNDFGRAGLAPSAHVFAGKIADDTGALYLSYAIEALGAIADGSVAARVVSYSLSVTKPPATFVDAIGALDAAGVVLVAAAANCPTENCSDANNDDFPYYPASDPGAHVLSVASSGPGGAFNPMTHYGPTSVDLAAPGMNVCSFTFTASHDDTVATESGTSYSAPLVAAAAALAWEAHPDLTHHELVSLVRATAKPNAAWAGKTTSGGVLDVPSLLHTPYVRVSAPDAASVLIRNLAGAGDVQIVFAHDAAIALQTPPHVRAQAHEGGTAWTVSLAAHAEVTLSVARMDHGAQPVDVTVHASVAAQALALDTVPLTLHLDPAPRPLDPAPPADSAPSNDPPASVAAAPTTSEPSPTPTAHACNASGAPLGLAVALALLVRRRRAGPSGQSCWPGRS